MTAPNLRQWRDVVVMPDGTRKFLVTAELQSVGTGTDTLPCREIFVVSISDAITPRSDVFARIATPIELRSATGEDVYVKVDSADLHTISGDLFARVANAAEITSLARTRNEALRRGQVEYLTPVVTFVYDDVATATAAFQTIIERVSHLYTDWKALRDGFMVAGSTNYTLPVSDIGIRTTTQAAYYAARQTREDAETARDEDELAKTLAERDLAQAQTIQTLLDEDVRALQACIDAITPMTETATLAWTPPAPSPVPGYSLTFANVVKNFVLGGDPRSIVSLLNAKLTALGQQRVAVQTYTNQVTVAGQRYAASVAAVEAARAAEESALAAARAACSRFTPTP